MLGLFFRISHIASYLPDEILINVGVWVPEQARGHQHEAAQVLGGLPQAERSRTALRLRPDVDHHR
jgi:hypothetical protein